MSEMNSYNLSRAWFDFCFDNPEKIRPNHSAIYFFAIEHCNRLGWKKKFGFPSQMAMEAVGIKNWRTYSKTLKDLVEWGFIKMIETSKNQYSANVIALVKNTKASTKASTKALDKALQKHGTKQRQSIVSVDKQERTLEQGTIELTAFEGFQKKYKGRKRGPNTEFENFKKKHKDWKTVVLDLESIIDIQNVLTESAEKEGCFVPPWKNLQTWINGRFWEEDLVFKKKNNSDPQKVVSQELEDKYNNVTPGF